MRRDIALAGFVLTSAEWDDMDELARNQILEASVEVALDDVYESYQLFYSGGG
jgi:hypothetical protein